nr:transcription factor, MADS-box [Tanacetum cinerariifolium]
MATNFRSNADHTRLISKSIFVANFPDNTSSKDLWKLCQDYGTVVDVYIPSRKSKAGKSFAFVPFIKVENIDRLVASLARPNHIGASSFATVLKGNNTPVNASEAPAMVPMELINDEKKRKLAFIRRKEGSLKKARELATLCDVNVSMIISFDYQKSPGNFPQDPRILNDMINVYKRNRVNGKIRSYGLLEFCKDGKDNINVELAKTKKGNLEGKSIEGDKHYEVLGVSTKASNVELTRAYRKTMFVVHPDKCLEFSEAAIEATKRVGDAYRVLSDDVARRNYDHMFKSFNLHLPSDEKDTDNDYELTIRDQLLELRE